MFYQTVSFSHDMYNPRLRVRENDEASATPAVDSSHLDYRKFVSDFMISLVFLAIRPMMSECLTFNQALS